MEERSTYQQHQQLVMSAAKILRRSIHIFLTSFYHFTSNPVLLALPFSITLLLLPSSISSISLSQIHIHFWRRALFSTIAGLSSSSNLYSLLCLKLLQTLLSTALTFPFSLSFLLFAKSAVIHSLTFHPPSITTFFSLFHTQLYNLVILLTVHSTGFSLLSLSFAAAATATNSHHHLFFIFISVIVGAVYSAVVTTTIIVCNLALVVSGCDQRGGFIAIHKSCIMLRCEIRTALSLALPLNLLMAVAEWLFHYWVLSGDSGLFRPVWVLAGEGMLISYLYSILIVFDVIVGCLFYQRCQEVGILKEFYDQEVIVELENESDPKKLSVFEQGQFSM